MRWYAARIYVVRNQARKIEMITAWAALESTARLITENARIDTPCRTMFSKFNGELQRAVDEYSEVNIELQDHNRA